MGEAFVWLGLPDSFLMGILFPGRYGILVELDLEGRIVDSYHDTSGSLVKDISQVWLVPYRTGATLTRYYPVGLKVVDDGGKYLYLGSFSNPYLGRILKH